MIKTILFDNDGILVNTEHIYYEVTRRIMQKAGFTLTEQMFIDLFLKQGKGAWHLLEAEGIPNEKINQLRDERNSEYFNECEKRNSLIKGADEVVKKLKEKYKMAIVTSCQKKHFNAIHNNTNMLQYFDFILTREDYEKSKPNPEPYLVGFEKSGCKKSECIVVEDSERGLKAANTAGIKCIIIPQGFTVNGNFSSAEKVLNSILELPDYLEQKNNE